MSRPFMYFSDVQPDNRSRYERAFNLQKIKEEALRRIALIDKEIEQLTSKPQ